ncbi:hypothetical protein HMPREF7215_1550 [Pyramidobacter piscolens W5455]|uniref:Uncharacterized protein n=1 Tax=Pyramidobacter piscolens W5455 TaxID=352165 RepID=A0ABM9ZX84_9BACT|nr:hypothetical protein HMPREF7215_1550 [Pyramidobacter piscolens W5455]
MPVAVRGGECFPKNAKKPRKPLLGALRGSFFCALSFIAPE